MDGFLPAPAVVDELLSFARRVRGARLTVGFSQPQLADILGLRRTFVGSLEPGERNVSPVHLYVSMLSRAPAHSKIIAS